MKIQFLEKEKAEKIAENLKNRINEIVAERKEQDGGVILIAFAAVIGSIIQDYDEIIQDFSLNTENVKLYLMISAGILFLISAVVLWNL